MKKQPEISGSEIICKTLEALCIEHLIGVPGTQNAHFYHFLHKSSLKPITPTSELSASFMANGYYRSSGKIAVIKIIGGPGLTFAFSGIAEAFLDSVPMLCLVGSPDVVPYKTYQHQLIDQRAIIRPVVKAIYEIKTVDKLQEVLNEAYLTALSDEPGPVYIELAKSVYTSLYNYDPESIKQYSPFKNKNLQKLVDEVITKVSSSPRVLLFTGQGANQMSAEIREIAEWLNSPVITTSSGRGILPEDHPLLFPYSNVVRGGGETIKNLIKTCDLVIALGCKFSWNGGGGFVYEFPKEKLIHVDTSADVLNANYPAEIAIQADVRDFIEEFQKKRIKENKKQDGWTNEELVQWQNKATAEINDYQESQLFFKGISDHSAKGFFKELMANLPEDTIIVTDAGQHQMLTRKYFRVKKVRRFIIPSNFQSMGFGIPAALGAKLVNPSSTVVVIIGDGGFSISATELLTAIREKINIKVIVFNNNSLGLIRIHQLNKFGFAYSTDLLNPDYAKFSDSLKIKYVNLSEKKVDEFWKNLKTPSTALLEVTIKDSKNLIKKRSKIIVNRQKIKLKDKLRGLLKKK